MTGCIITETRQIDITRNKVNSKSNNLQRQIKNPL